MFHRVVTSTDFGILFIQLDFDQYTPFFGFIMGQIQVLLNKNEPIKPPIGSAAPADRSHAAATPRSAPPYSKQDLDKD
jgi:hypothetical protein